VRYTRSGGQAARKGSSLAVACNRTCVRAETPACGPKRISAIVQPARGRANAPLPPHEIARVLKEDQMSSVLSVQWATLGNLYA